MHDQEAAATPSTRHGARLPSWGVSSRRRTLEQGRILTSAVSRVFFPPFNKTAEKDAIKLMNDAFEPMRQLDRRSGSYMNEVGPSNAALASSRPLDTQMLTNATGFRLRKELAAVVLGRQLPEAVEDQAGGRSG